MNSNAREAILVAAREMVQSHGFGGLNFRDLAQAVGIKAPSIYYHFESKVELGAAIAKRYWQDGQLALDAISAAHSDPLERLRKFPDIFRRSLLRDNRLCLGSFMGAETSDLPEAINEEVLTFSDVNVAWLSEQLLAAGLTRADESQARANAIFAAVAGAQLIARARKSALLFETLIDNYRSSGLLPG